MRKALHFGRNYSVRPIWVTQPSQKLRVIAPFATLVPLHILYSTSRQIQRIYVVWENQPLYENPWFICQHCTGGGTRVLERDLSQGSSITGLNHSTCTNFHDTFIGEFHGECTNAVHVTRSNVDIRTEYVNRDGGTGILHGSETPVQKQCIQDLC